MAEERDEDQFTETEGKAGQQPTGQQRQPSADSPWGVSSSSPQYGQ